MASRTWWYAKPAGKLAAPYQKHQLGVPRLPIPTLDESCVDTEAPLRPAPTALAGPLGPRAASHDALKTITLSPQTNRSGARATPKL